MKKPTPRPANPAMPGGLPAFADEDWVLEYPNLCRFLADDTYDDGSARDLGTITIKAEDGRVLVVLNDREEKRGLYHSCVSVKEGLEALEAQCIDPRADWRAWKGGAAKKRS